MSKILVVGLNPAWQKVLEFRDFRMGEVNRAHTATALASGKGFNAAKVLRRLGHDVGLLQILGGVNGHRCLEACEAMGIASLHAWVDAETRECITLLPGSEGKGATEVIEPFRAERPGLEEDLLATLPAGSGAFDAVAVCGTAPAGMEDGLYDRLLALLKPAITVIDAWQGLGAEALARATCVKLNRAEYESLAERSGTAGISEARFLITAGNGEAIMMNSGRIEASFTPPHLSRALNPIGAGDTVTAGVTHHLLSGFGLAEAFRHGLAMGTASCLHRLPAEYAETDFLRLLPLVEAGA